MRGELVPDIVIIDDDALHARHLCQLASAHRLAASRIGTGDAAIEGVPLARLAIIRSEQSPDVVRRVTARHPGMTTIVLSDHARADLIIDCMRAGASDVLPTDLSHPDAVARLKQHFGACTYGSAQPSSAGAPCRFGLAGHSAAMERVRNLISRLGPSDATTLIEGPTGVGKELVAVALHRQGRHASGPLIAVNCGAIPDDLLEGEFFGYEKGAFSGAVNSYPGKLALADGGTLFLDEVGELSLSGQVKLLRAIEARQCYRLGGRRPHDFNIRIIAATNRQLESEVAAGRFRSDLFYRIAVARIGIPRLADRPGDIVALAQYFIDQLVQGSGRIRPALDDGGIAVLQGHDWPGNARELRNAIEVALLCCDGRTIRADDFPPHLRPQVGVTASLPAGRDAAAIAGLCDAAIDRALADCGGNKSEAARVLGCSRMTLYRHLQRG
jgi:DNA-binding NtrC family response regulator